MNTDRIEDSVQGPNDLAFMRDTDLATQRIYYAMLKKISPDQRLANGLRLSRMTRNAHLALIRERRPELTPDEVRREYLRAILKPEEFRAFYPEKK